MNYVLTDIAILIIIREFQNNNEKLLILIKQFVLIKCYPADS
jgi:hypothetical protein